MRKISEKYVIAQKLWVLNVHQCTPFCPVFYSALVHHSVSMPSLLVLSYASVCLVLYNVITPAQTGLFFHCLFQTLITYDQQSYD